MVHDIHLPAKIIHGLKAGEISSELAANEIIKLQIVLVIIWSICECKITFFTCLFEDVTPKRSKRTREFHESWAGVVRNAGPVDPTHTVV